MTPEERDRLRALEVEVRHLKDGQDSILKIVTGLEKKSAHFSGGLVILAGVGGILYWLIQTVITSRVWGP